MSNSAPDLEQLLAGAGPELAGTLRALRRRRAAMHHREELLAWAAFARIGRGLAERTVSRYLAAVAEFLDWLEQKGTTLAQATAPDVRAWTFALFVAHQSAATRGIKVVALRSFFRWRAENGLGCDAAASVPLPRREHRVPRKFTVAQLDRIFSTCDRTTVRGRRDFALLAFLLGTGARRGEVAGLTLEHIELGQRGGAVRFFGKGSRERIVTFDSAVADSLRLWLSDRDALGPLHPGVFIALTGRAKCAPLGPTGIDRVLRRRLVAAGVRVAPGQCLHLVRSTYATALLDQGFGVEEIRITLGHADLRTTQRYLALSERSARVRLNMRTFLGRRPDGGLGMPRWAKQKLAPALGAGGDEQ